MDNSPATIPAPASTQAQTDQGQPAAQTDALAHSETPGFRSRGRARRRARFLRKARELAYRDLGGLVFNLHRFGQRNDALVFAKLTTLSHIDDELRAIEASLGERQPLTVLREAGITACPRCAAIHSSEDNFCPNCGLSMGRHVDLPVGFQATSAPSTAAPAAPIAPTPAPSTAAPAAPTAPTPAPSTAAPARAPAVSPAEQEEDGPTEILRPLAPGP